MTQRRQTSPTLTQQKVLNEMEIGYRYTPYALRCRIDTLDALADLGLVRWDVNQTSSRDQRFQTVYWRER